MNNVFLHTILAKSSGLGGGAKSFWEFLRQGGPFMGLIALASIVSFAAIVYKALTLRRDRTLPPNVEDQLAHCEEWAKEGRFDELIPWLRLHPSTASRVGIFALETRFTDRDEARKSVESNAREEIVKLERGIAVLEVIITIAPLLGLLGTVAGLVGVFGNLGAASSTNDYTLIAKGISEALGTTIAGLVVAVPAVIAHSYFSKKIETLAVRMEVLVGHLVNIRFRLAAEPLPKDMPTPVERELLELDEEEDKGPGEDTATDVFSLKT